MKSTLKVVTSNYVHTIVVNHLQAWKEREREKEREGGGRDKVSLHIMLPYGVRSAGD